MEVTKRDIEETKFIRELHKNIQNISQEDAYKVTERMRINQPFLVSLLMSFESEVTEDQFDHLMEMFLLIFLFFEEKSNIRKAEITEDLFNKQYELNLQFMDYLDGEDDMDSQMDLGEMDLQKMHHKSLYTSIIFLTDESNCFDGVKDEDLKNGVFVISKALIECMETNLLEK